MATTSSEVEKTSKKKNNEGTNLLGALSFTELENGRFKCVETGHELLAKDKDSYSHSKRCRLGLIDFALSKNKPPLNIFKQDPLSRSKLICKLTGDTVNKSEEHIWKHINGKRFLNKLEEKETGKSTSNGTVEEQAEQKPQKASKQSTDGLKKKKKKNKKKKLEEEEEEIEDKEKDVEAIISEVRNLLDDDIDAEEDDDIDAEEDDFWMPPVGDRWDFDDGGDRWDSGSESGQESDEVNETDGPAEEGGQETEELSTGTKRMTIEMGPSSFASRKKKSKKNQTN
uniref:Surfeit locus protein 2 n=1 Tax=Fagus sylvatica TaxID=28930 RepID=A0A2N9FT84_FAGSY